jgi:hypothetical protein
MPIRKHEGIMENVKMDMRKMTQYVEEGALKEIHGAENELGNAAGTRIK